MIVSLDYIKFSKQLEKILNEAVMRYSDDWGQLKISYTVSDDFIRDLDFYLSGKIQDNFTTILIKLLFKADSENLLKLCKSFPSEVATVILYQNYPNFSNIIFKQ